jgi:hypothetical protein
MGQREWKPIYRSLDSSAPLIDFDGARYREATAKYAYDSARYLLRLVMNHLQKSAGIAWHRGDSENLFAGQPNSTIRLFTMSNRKLWKITKMSYPLGGNKPIYRIAIRSVARKTHSASSEALRFSFQNSFKLLGIARGRISTPSATICTSGRLGVATRVTACCLKPTTSPRSLSSTLCCYSTIAG